MKSRSWLPLVLLIWMGFVYGLYFHMVKDAGQLQRVKRGIDKIFAGKASS